MAKTGIPEPALPDQNGLPASRDAAPASPPARAILVLPHHKFLKKVHTRAERPLPRHHAPGIPDHAAA
jgi:hypothetical protein